MRKSPFTVCVVGGGFTGSAAAIACLTRIKTPFRLVMIEPSDAPTVVPYEVDLERSLKSEAAA